MKSIVIFLSTAVLLVSFLTSSLYAGQWKLAWKTGGLLNPESIILDEKRGLYYVSLQNYPVKSGGGAIAKLGLNGTVISKTWITGLNKPKGLLLVKDRLYVSDVNVLVEIDIKNGKVLRRHEAPGAQFLNDVAVDTEGNVYVSDMFTSSIYRLDNRGNFILWIQDPKLQNPNGLYVHEDTLYVAAWGPFTDGKPRTAPKGHLLAVSLVNESIVKVSDAPIGNLDGLQRFKKDIFLVSDWLAGGIFKFSRTSQKLEKIISTPVSVGDIAYVKGLNMILVPMAKQKEVLAFKLME